VHDAEAGQRDRQWAAPRWRRRLQQHATCERRDLARGDAGTGFHFYPVQAPYRMVQSLMGLKLVVEKAMAANGGKKPTHE